MHADSLTVTVAGTNIGMTHGHQVMKPENVPDYVAKQIAGRQPLETADVILSGHFHHLRVMQGIGGRWFIQAPTNDNGSSWYSTVSGQTSTPGVLTFTTKGRGWADLKVHA